MAMSKHDKQVCDNVRYFFNHDFEKYKQLAELADLKTVSYDGINSSTNINHQENKAVTASYYQNIVDTVKKVIDRIQDEHYKQLLIYRHFEHLAFWQIAQRMQYSEITVKTLINQAYLLFADMLAIVTDIDLRKDDYIETDKH